MADYVSILRRTLDGLGSGATPALRERVYGRARDAVRRQLDGMVPPPADDVKARQLEQLEAAVAEVEAGYAAPGDGPSAEIDTPSSPAAPPVAGVQAGEPASAGTSAGTSTGLAADAPTDPSPRASEPAAPASEQRPSESATEPRRVVVSETADDAVAKPPAAPTPPPPPSEAEPTVPGPVSVSGSMASLIPGAAVGSPSSGSPSTGSPTPPLPPVDDLPPSTAYAPRADDAAASPSAATDTASAASPDDAPPPPAPEAISDAESGMSPQVLDQDGPVGGYLPDEALPSVAMIGHNGDPVLDPADAVPLGATGAVATFAAPPPADTPVDSASIGTAPGAFGDTFGVDAGSDGAPAADGPPASTLAAADLPRPEPLSPVTLEPAPLGSPDAGSGLGAVGGLAGAGMAAGGSALAFANRGRPDLPTDGTSPSGSTPSDGVRSDDPGAPPVAMPRTDGPSDPFGVGPAIDTGAATGTPPATEPAAPPAGPGPGPVPVVGNAPVEAAPRGPAAAPVTPSFQKQADADRPPQVDVPPDAKSGGRGGLWATLALLLLVLGGLLFARAPLADATGIEGFRTAFGLGPVFDRTVGSLLGGSDDGTDVADDVVDDTATDVPTDVADGPTIIAPTDPADAPVEDVAVAGTGTKVPDRLPTGDAAVDVTPGDTDVTVTPVPVETVSPDAPPAPGTEEVAVLRPDDPTTPDAPAAPPAGAGRAFLVGEPVAGVSDRAEGSVSWSVAQESPGRDLPPEPAIRGDVTLGDGTAVEVTVRRNADESLPASHLIEIVFALPDGGRTVNRLPLVGFKDSLAVPARPLVAVPAKITDDFFVVGLNSLASAVQSNLSLMGSEQFMDVQLIDGSDRRATLTLEKGTDGTTVFGEVLDAWNDSPLPG